MRHVLVTGAGGYIGRALSRALVPALRDGRTRTLTLVDLDLPDTEADAPGMRRLRGDLADADVLRAATEPAPTTVFHLAGITSRLAEEQFALGLRVNLLCTVSLFERLREQAQQPVLVYASSIGVFGTPLPEHIDDATPPAPTLSYGAQKRAIEVLLADYARRGWIDGRALRLPTVVARPAQAQVALSSFASELIREIAEGRPYTCPVGADAQLWWLSLPACVEHLRHAAALPADALPAQRVWSLPALRANVDDVVQALRRRFGAEVDARLRFAPQAALQAQFAQWPPLSTATARRLGQQHDGDLDTLIERALGR